MMQKAAKDDDSSISLYFWDQPFLNRLLELGRSADFIARVMDQLIGSQSTPLLMVLRSFVLCAWRKSVFKSFARYM
jgi:hypothetical protein